jgi:lipopolysaccharide transport system permease protein
MHKNDDQHKHLLTVYRPHLRHERGFFSTWKIMLMNIFQARELIWQLFKRDFFGSYRKSFIGVTWIVISPIVGILSWVFLQKTGMLKPGESGIPYPAYVLIGTSMWGLFMGFFNAAKDTLAAGQTLILQVNYPHESLLFMQTAQHLANFIVAFALNIIVLLLFGVVPSWKIVFFPLVILPLFFLAAAIGLVVSMVSVLSLDVDKVAQVILGLTLWITPIIYTESAGGDLVRTIIAWNPLTYLVCSARDIIIQGTLYQAAGYFICAFLSFLLFMVSWRLFYISEDKIIERMI